MGGAGRTAGGYRAVPSDTDTSAIDSDANAVMTDGGDQESSGTGKNISFSTTWIELRIIDILNLYSTLKTVFELDINTSKLVRQKVSLFRLQNEKKCVRSKSLLIF